MGLDRATLTNVSVADARPVTVMYNPTELTITSNMLYPDISVPGLRTPLLQFVRGEAKTLEAELFLDRSNSGESLQEDLKALRDFITIDENLHAPPVCRFAWGDTSFIGVMVEFKEKFQMFDEKGAVLRARVTVKLKAYESANLQYTEINQQSPDRTKIRTVRLGDRYDLIAAEEYGDPALWSVLAAANGDERPRLLAPGDIIEVPPL
jgi:Contractile injection system tube protein